MTFSEIWEKNKSHLLSFIKTRVEDKTVAEDILQEVAVKLLNNLNRKTNIENHEKWLFQVTRNTVADFYRKTNKKIDELEYDVKSNSESEVCICDLSEFVINTYLPETYSKPLYLSDIKQLPQQEIAEILQLSLTATKSRIQRARKKLKALISDCIDLSYNKSGQITDFQLKDNCELPEELKVEMQRLNLML